MRNRRARHFTKRAIVLLSGGLDSAVALYYAKKKGFNCFCLIFDYGQRHKIEIRSAKLLAKTAGSGYKIIRLPFFWKGSSLLDRQKAMPRKPGAAGKIPGTYVPARNIVFLSLALSYAESTGAGTVFIGAHAQDYSGYPDCRPEFYRAFRKVVACGTKAGVEKNPVRIEAPLLNKTKAQIIKMGSELGVPFKLTWSCYRGEKKPCGRCDSCYFRAKGFREAGINDPQPEL